MPTLEAATLEAVESPVHVVLEIDDELERSILKSRHFEDIGAGHELAASLEEARNVLRAMAPTQRAGSKKLVIVLDLMFRDNYEAEEGIRFVREIREGSLGIHPNVPIVILSNARSPQIMEQAFIAGANAFFSKSDSPTLILEKIRFYLGHETIDSRHICEVCDLDSGHGKVRVRLRAQEKWILERWMPIDFCPPEARVVGGSFYWDNISFFEDYHTQYKLRTLPIEARNSVEQLLDPEWRC